MRPLPTLLLNSLPRHLVLSAPRAGLFGLTLTALAPLGSAQWVVYNLHPTGGISSISAGGDASQQAGDLYTAPGITRAGFWSGTAASFVDLHPAGAFESNAVAVDGGKQFGHVDSGTGLPHATLWAGTAASALDLNPAGAAYSFAYGAGGGQQVGAIDPGSGNFNAALWSGSAASFVNLNPAGSNFSVARDAHGGWQFGQAHFPAVHAGLWHGTAASWVDLHPAVAVQSQGFALDASQQVGKCMIGSTTVAALWSGSAASFVNLQPTWAASSEAMAVDGGEQVGQANYPFGYMNATIWSGTAASAVNLHNFLPANLSQLNSYATAIWHSGPYTFVLGYAYNSTTGSYEALLWKKLPVTAYCSAKVNSLGCTPSMSAQGTPSASASNTFYVRSSNMQNNKVGVLFYGSSGRNAAPFSGGTLCVNAPLKRVSGLNSGGSNPPANNCSGEFLVDMNAFRAGQLGGSPAGFLSVPGTVVDCQFWGRDSGFAAPNNTQLSNGLEFEVGP